MARGKKPARHLIDGREMTVDEIAAMLGVTAQALRVRRSNMGGVSYQVIVNMYRDGRVGGIHDKWPRHLVDGEWITVKEAARRVGVHPRTINRWMCLNHGTTLGDAMAHYRRYQTGELKRWPGPTPKRHYVNGVYLTIAEAAEKYGSTENAMRMYIRKHNCSLHSAVRRLETRQKKQAEKDIMKILGFLR